MKTYVVQINKTCYLNIQAESEELLDKALANLDTYELDAMTGPDSADWDINIIAEELNHEEIDSVLYRGSFLHPSDAPTQEKK